MIQISSRYLKYLGKIHKIYIISSSEFPTLTQMKKLQGNAFIQQSKCSDKILFSITDLTLDLTLSGIQFKSLPQ